MGSPAWLTPRTPELNHAVRVRRDDCQPRLTMGLVEAIELHGNPTDVGILLCGPVEFRVALIPSATFIPPSLEKARYKGASTQRTRADPKGRKEGQKFFGAKTGSFQPFRSSDPLKGKGSGFWGIRTATFF